MSTFARRRRLAAGVLAVSGLMATAMGSASAVPGTMATASALRIATGTLPLGTTLGQATASGPSQSNVGHVARVALPPTSPVVEVSAGSTAAETGIDKAVASANLAGVGVTPSALLANQMVSEVLDQGRSQLQALAQQVTTAQQTILGTVNVLGSVTGSVTLTALGSELTLGGEQSAELQQIAQQIVGNVPDVDPVALADDLTGDLRNQIEDLIAQRLDIRIEALRTQCRLDAPNGVATGQTELVFSPDTWSQLQALNPPALAPLPVTTTQGGNVSVQVPANTTIDLGGLVKLVLNEQAATSGAGASYTVNGIHLQVAGLDVTLSSSHCQIGGTFQFNAQIPENDVLGVYVPDMHPYLEADIDGNSDTGNLLGGDLGNALGALTGGGTLDLGLRGGVNPSGPLGLVAGPLSFSRTLDPIGGTADLGAIGQATASLGGLLQLSGLMP